MSPLKCNPLLLCHSLSNDISSVILQWQDCTLVSHPRIVTTSVSPEKSIHYFMVISVLSWLVIAEWPGVSQVCISHQWPPVDSNTRTGTELVLDTRDQSDSCHPILLIYGHLLLRLFYDTPKCIIKLTGLHISHQSLQDVSTGW